jgi:DnaJ-class molecular chaperone
MSDTKKEARFEECERCEGTGDHHVHMPTFYDPYYMSRTNRPCEYCDGKGKIEIEDEPADEQEAA